MTFAVDLSLRVFQLKGSHFFLNKGFLICLTFSKRLILSPFLQAPFPFFQSCFPLASCISPFSGAELCFLTLALGHEPVPRYLPAPWRDPAGLQTQTLWDKLPSGLACVPRQAESLQNHPRARDVPSTHHLRLPGCRGPSGAGAVVAAGTAVLSTSCS